jgi:hypothetical protein
MQIKKVKNIFKPDYFREIMRKLIHNYFSESYKVSGI